MNPQPSTYCPKYPGVSGMKMPVFAFFEGVNYPFGYQSSLKDDEICGSGNAYSTYFRELDVRLGRWFAIDPKTSVTSWESPFVSMGDNPIWYYDPIGDRICTKNMGIGDKIRYYYLIHKLKKIRCIQRGL